MLSPDHERSHRDDEAADGLEDGRAHNERWRRLEL
jgi:hypothetical protein